MRPKVDIVVTTYNNLSYLKLCIESIRAGTDWPYNIIVVASGNKDGTFDWILRQPDVIHFLSDERLCFSQANNAGIAISKEEYVCLLNDDTIVGKGWLTALMAEGMKQDVGAVGPLSNSDRTVNVSGRDLVSNMSIEDVKDFIPEIQSFTHEKQVICNPRTWIAFYCALLKKEAIIKVGVLDEDLVSAYEDIDYCRRIKMAGYLVCQTLDSWVFHFGGRTRNNPDLLSAKQYEKEESESRSHMTKKWGS